MNTDEAALLRAICADRADDTIRLVYADYLEENGQPERAEFIRLQLERSRLEPYALRRYEIEPRELELLKAFRSVWATPLPRELHGKSRCTFERGFPTYIKPHLEGWLRWGKSLTDRLPLERIWFRRVEADQPMPNPSWVRLCRMTELADIKHLDFSYLNLPPDAIDILTNSHHFHALRELSLYSNSLTLDVIHQLAEWSLAAQLEFLDISSLPLADPSVFRSLRAMPRLHTLLLRDIQLNDSGAMELASVPLPHLRHFRVNWSQLTVTSMHRLMGAPWFSQLSNLYLHASHLTDEALKVLESMPMPNLDTFISGHHGPLNPSEISAIARAPWLQSLQGLGLDRVSNLDDIIPILNSLRHPTLRFLIVHFRHCSESGISALAHCPALSGLVELYLSGDVLSDADTEIFANSPYLQNLRILTISASKAGYRRLRQRFPHAVVK